MMAVRLGQLLLALVILNGQPVSQAWCADGGATVDTSSSAVPRRPEPNVALSHASRDLKWGDPKQAFRVAARLDQTQFAAGEPVRLGLWLQNVGSELAPWSTDHAYLVEVYDSLGKPIEPTAMWSSVLSNFGNWKYAGGYENFFQSDYAAGEIKRQFDFPLHLMFDLSVEGRYEARVVRMKSKWQDYPLPGDFKPSFEISQ